MCRSLALGCTVCCLLALGISGCTSTLVSNVQPLGDDAGGGDSTRGDTARGDTGGDDPSSGDHGGGDTASGETPFALRFDAGLLSGTATYAGREFSPLMTYVENATGDRHSCDATNDYCDDGPYEIFNTAHDSLYRSQIWSCGDALEIAIPLADGTYDLCLHNAETTPVSGEVGGRLASVEVEGVIVISNWDVYLDAGEAMDTAVRRILPVTVTDGQLNLRLITNVRCPKICGVEILAGGELPLPLESDGS